MDGGAYCCMPAIFNTQNRVRVALRRIKLNIASYVCIALYNLTTQLACSLDLYLRFQYRVQVDCQGMYRKAGA